MASIGGSLRTASLFESGDSDGDVSLSSLFSGGCASTTWKDISADRIAGLIARGGWPEVRGMDEDEAVGFNRDILEDIIGTQVCRIDRSVNPSTVRKLLEALALNESTVSSDRKVRSDMLEGYDDVPIAQRTFVKYIGVLEALDLIWDQPAFDPGLGYASRVSKAPKRHLIDPSLAVAACGMTKEGLLDDRRMFERFFEALCERDLRIYAESLGWLLGHYRDGDGRTIDAVVELPDGRWGAFDIVLRREGIDDRARNLVRIRDYIGRKGGRVPSVLCVICGTAETAKLRPDGVHVVPITRLKARSEQNTRQDGRGQHPDYDRRRSQRLLRYP